MDPTGASVRTGPNRSLGTTVSRRLVSKDERAHPYLILLDIKPFPAGVKAVLVEPAVPHLKLAVPHLRVEPDVPHLTVKLSIHSLNVSLVGGLYSSFTRVHFLTFRLFTTFFTFLTCLHQGSSFTLFSNMYENNPGIAALAHSYRPTRKRIYPSLPLRKKIISYFTCCLPEEVPRMKFLWI